MRKFIVLAAAILLAMAVFLLASPNGGRAPRTPGGTIAVTHEPSATQPRDAPKAAASSVPWRQPPPKAVYEFDPPVFQALPGGLNGRPLKDIYDELAKLAESGDAEAARVLGDLVADCSLMLESQKVGKRFGSPDPLVQKHIDERERVAAKECPTLGEQALGSANLWYMRGAEGGDRKALLWLRYYPPKPTEPDAEARKEQWRALLTGQLERLGNDGDFEAMVSLASFYLEEGNFNPASTKAAYAWFDKASRAPVNADRISHVSRMRDIAGQRIAAEEQRRAH